MKTTSCSPNGIRLATKEYDLEEAEARPILDAGHADLLEEEKAAEPPVLPQEPKQKGKKLAEKEE